MLVEVGQGECFLVIIAHDGDIAEVYDFPAAADLREDDVDVYGYFQGLAASHVQVNEAINLFGLVAYHRVVDLFLLLAVQDY